MFTVELTIGTNNRFVTSLDLAINTSEEIHTLIANPQKSLLPLATNLSPAEYQFLLFWRTHYATSKKKGLILTPPFSGELLSFFGEVPTIIHHDSSYSVTSSPKIYTPNLFLDIAHSHISFKSQESSFLFLGSTPFVWNKKSFQKLQIPFDQETIKSLYQNNQAILTPEDIIFLTSEIKKPKSYFNTIMTAPKIIESANIVPIFEFQHQQNKYEITLFLESEINGKTEQFTLDLEQAKKYLKQEQPFTLAGSKNSVLMVPTDHPVRAKLDSIVKTIFQNFYTVLGEIRENRIITDDKANLFENFLPQVSDGIALYKNNRNKKLRFVLANSDPSVAITNTSSTPLFGSMDWLSIDFEFDHQAVQLTLKDLAQIIQHGFVEKEDAIITIPEEKIDPLKKLLEFGRKNSSEQIEIQASFLPWLLSLYPNSKIPEEWSALKNFIATNTLPEITLPNKIEPILRDYQKIGVKRLSLLTQFGFGVVLADEMGLGKTLQVLTLLDIHSHEGKSLIVTPSALTLNWFAEIEKFYPNRFKTIIIQGNKATRSKLLESIDEYDIVITSYHTLGSDQELYTNQKFQFLVIDEAQHIKNKNAKRSKMVKTINARSRIAVSGTPLENNISELWSIFDFIMPSFLGTHKNFQQKFEEPLRDFDMEKRKSVLQHLHQVTSPFIIRRTKATTYKELPPKIEQTIIAELTDKQKTLYLDTLSQVRSDYLNIMESRGFQQSRIEFLSTLTKLRQIALHPALVYHELYKEDSEEFSAKITILLELLLEAFDSGHRVLIFSQFVSMLELIKPELDKQNIEYLYIDGKTTNRVELADRFNQGETPVFLISLKAGGVGLNLTGADTVILFDPWWNPSVENQAIDRAHRIGQDKPVNVYRLMTKGTIEEKIYNLQRKKAFLFDNIMQENPNFETFSTEELLSLLQIEDNSDM